MLEDLLRRAIAGDLASLDRLLDANVGWMRALVRRLVARSRAPAFDANDLLQSALTTAVEKISHFEIRDAPEAQFRAWLTQIVANTVRAAARCAKSRLLALESVLERDGQAPVLTPSRRTARSERLRRLDQFVSELPAPDQAVIRRHYLGSQSEQETARALGMTTEAVHAALARARRVLRKKMGESSMWWSSCE